jgi:hypothetical protein
MALADALSLTLAGARGLTNNSPRAAQALMATLATR